MVDQVRRRAAAPGAERRDRALKIGDRRRTTQHQRGADHPDQEDMGVLVIEINLIPARVKSRLAA